MIRLPVSKDRVAPRLPLDKAERHYLLDVLRLQPGARLEVFDGAGGVYSAALAEDGWLVLGERREAPARREVTLAQSLPKGDKMDLVVQKATELGAAAIAPFVSEHTVVRLEPRKAEERVARWQRIAEQAARQCGRADVPRVLPVVTLAEALKEQAARKACSLLLYEKERALRLARAAADTEAPLALFTGPEGGFSEAEVALALELGARAVSLGPLVLRTETVALAALAVVQHLEGQLG